MKLRNLRQEAEYEVMEEVPQKNAKFQLRTGQRKEAKRDNSISHVMSEVITALCTITLNTVFQESKRSAFEESSA